MLSVVQGNSSRLGSPEDRLRRARRTFSLVVLLGANFLPLLGVLFWRWRLFDLLVVYWLETLVIGAFAILQIALTSGRFALFQVPFFAIHFGGFMVGHFFFLTMMFGDERGTGFSEMPGVAYRLVVNHGLWLAMLGLCISHGVGFVLYFLAPRMVRSWRERDRQPRSKPSDISGDLMSAPYRRVIIMHLSILIGALLVDLSGNRLVVLMLLVALKTASDLFVFWRGEKKPVPVTATAWDPA